MLDNINDEKKEHLKKRITKEKKTKGDNLDGNKKEQLRNYGKIRKETICDNLDDKQKEHLKIEATKRQELAWVSICLTSKIWKGIWQMVIWSENMFKENLLLQFSCLEEFH